MRELPASVNADVAGLGAAGTLERRVVDAPLLEQGGIALASYLTESPSPEAPLQLDEVNLTTPETPQYSAVSQPWPGCS